MNDSLFIGLDFGSDSVRAVLVDADGKPFSESVRGYSRWGEGRYSDAAENRFRHHPLDYLESMEAVIREVASGADAARVAAIGVDATASTPCLVDRTGTPLALSPEFAEDPDAMFFLWKDHSSVAAADRINEQIAREGAPYTAYEGGHYSPEWFWSKILHALRQSDRIREAAYSAIELCDWIPSVLTGSPARPGRSAAGHKAMWNARWGGLPPVDFFERVDPLLVPIRGRLYTETVTADKPVGRLSGEWAARLGLPASVVVSGGVIDCHAGALGSGVAPRRLVMVCGTSTGNIAVADGLDRPVPGVWGQADGSVIPGMTTIETGQAAFGDVYAWFRRLLGYAGEVSLARLEEDAASIPPGSTGLVALDWFNGRRTPYADHTKTGAIEGLTLGSTAPMVYRALAEGTVFGARAILEHLGREGVPVEEVVMTGGISRKSRFIMQLCADVFERRVHVADCDQTGALGSAILATVASGAYPDVETAMERMAAPAAVSYAPVESHFRAYRDGYSRYLALGARQP